MIQPADKPAATETEYVVGGILGIAVVAAVLWYVSSQGSNVNGGYTVIAPSAAVTTAALQAQSDSNAAQDALATTRSNNATSAFEAYINGNNSLALGLAQTQAGVELTRITAGSQVTIAQATDNAQVAIANSQADAARAISDNQTTQARGAQQTQNTSNWLNTIVKSIPIIGSFF